VLEVNKPSGMDVKPLHPLKHPEKLVTPVLEVNKPSGMDVKLLHP